MNKTELIKEISAKLETVTQKDVATIIDTFQDVIKDTVTSGEKVTLTGFLNFEKKHVPAKSGIVQLGAKKRRTLDNTRKG